MEGKSKRSVHFCSSLSQKMEALEKLRGRRLDPVEGLMRVGVGCSDSKSDKVHLLL